MTTCLEALAIVEEVSGAESVPEAWERPELAKASLAIVDVAAPEARTFVREVRLAYGVPSLVAGFAWDVDDMTAMVEAGAVGVLAKETLTPETLEANVRAALHGASVLPSELMTRMLTAPESAAGDPAPALRGQLSAREQQVLTLIAEGHATREVAAKLSYSERTIKNVLHDVATKLGARSRSQAVAHAVRSGLI
jgi:DNA-binding NarL/FixJ family response regulator